MRFDAPILWLIIVGIGAGTFLIRFSFIWLFGRGEIPVGVQRALRFVPASVLSALVLPSFIFTEHTTFALDNRRMWAGLIAALIAWRTRSMLLTIAVGMASLWLFAFLQFP